MGKACGVPQQLLGASSVLPLRALMAAAPPPGRGAILMSLLTLWSFDFKFSKSYEMREGLRLLSKIPTALILLGLVPNPVSSEFRKHICRLWQQMVPNPRNYEHVSKKMDKKSGLKP